ncbi:hypothetical protein HPB48_019612 [Haemaphysalis longicornis]|uniref:Regulatory protein zeste n=1 Tax=Haemaphysalis longicornis TaxID=44386 RepID=A0A9J6GGK3_HAELO|nr:hypothetical protein HPB48_019612 [Haemaphysalis longicornis]
MYNAVHGVYPGDAKQLKKGWGNIKQKWKEEKGEERRGRFKIEEHQADQADEDEHGHPTGDDPAVPFSGGAEVDELDAPTGADAAVLPPQGASAPSEDCRRPPRGRMALLHQHLGTEIDLRMALIKEGHDFRIMLLKEDNDATLALKTAKLQLEIRLLEQKKQHQEKMFEVQTKVEEARLQQEQFQAKLCELGVKVEQARLQKALEDV